MEGRYVKFVVYVPETHAEVVRQALGRSGAGRVGNYEYTSFSVKGVGRFTPLKGANPAVGAVGEYEEVPEERIETVCREDDVSAITAAVRAVHPYEHMAYDVYPILSNPEGVEVSAVSRSRVSVRARRAALP